MSSFDKNLKLISYCPLCHARYNPQEAKILDERENAHLLYIKCQKCLSSIIALIFMNNLGVSSMGLITDLNGEDIMKLKGSRDIGADDVIEMHKILESNDWIKNF